MSYSFTMKISGIDTRGSYEDALYAAGCSDALIAVVNGEVFLDFEREGTTFDQAVASATHSVESAGGKVVQVMPTPE